MAENCGNGISGDREDEPFDDIFGDLLSDDMFGFLGREGLGAPISASEVPEDELDRGLYCAFVMQALGLLTDGERLGVVSIPKALCDGGLRNGQVVLYSVTERMPCDDNYRPSLCIDQPYSQKRIKQQLRGEVEGGNIFTHTMVGVPLNHIRPIGKPVEAKEPV